MLKVAVRKVVLEICKSFIIKKIKNKNEECTKGVLKKVQCTYLVSERTNFE